MIVEGSSRINFDSCHYRELANPENLMNDWDVVISKPTSIDKAKEQPKQSFLERNQIKTKKFKVVNHRRKKQSQNQVKRAKKSQRGNYQQIIDREVANQRR